MAVGWLPPTRPLLGTDQNRATRALSGKAWLLLRQGKEEGASQFELRVPLGFRAKKHLGCSPPPAPQQEAGFSLLTITMPSPVSLVHARQQSSA